MAGLYLFGAIDVMRMVYSASAVQCLSCCANPAIQECARPISLSWIDQGTGNFVDAPRWHHCNSQTLTMLSDCWRYHAMWLTQDSSM